MSACLSRSLESERSKIWKKYSFRLIYWIWGTWKFLYIKYLFQKNCGSILSLKHLMVLECTCKNKKFHLKLPCSVVLLQKSPKLPNRYFLDEIDFWSIGFKFNPQVNRGTIFRLFNRLLCRCSTVWKWRLLFRRSWARSTLWSVYNRIIILIWDLILKKIILLSLVNSHVGAWSAWKHWAVKSILRVPVSLKRLHSFFVIILNSISTHFVEIKIFENFLVF